MSPANIIPTASDQNLIPRPFMNLVRLLLVLTFAFVTRPLRASDEVVRITSVKVGLDNAAKVGVTTLVQVGVEAITDVTGELSIVTPDPRGNPVRIATTVALKAGQSDVLPFSIAVGRLESTLAVEFHQAEQLLARRKLSCSEADGDADFRISRHAQPYWLVVGPLSAGTTAATRESEAAVTPGLNALRQVHRTALSSGSLMPSAMNALSAYDTVFLAGEFGLSDDSATTLERWVKNGGHLVALIGTRTSELQQSPLARWLPGDGRSLKAARLTDLSPLVFASQTEFPMPPANRVEGTLFNYSDGENIVRTFDGELVMRFAHGFGRVTLVGIDFDKRPLMNWRGLDGLVAALADLGQQENKAANDTERLSRTGISELQTQLHTALATFPETAEQSVPSMLGMVLLFLLLIGPLDYVIVHKWLKRPELTWVSFPGVVLLAVLAATVTAGSSRGEKVATNQLDFLDYDSLSGHLHHTSFATVYSPENRRYSINLSRDERLQLGPNTPQTGMMWLANPEPNFGGMYRVGGFEVGKPEYELSWELSHVRNAPISAGSTRSWRGEFETQLAEPLIEARLERQGVGQFTAESYISHRFAEPIDQWIIAFAGRVYYHSVRDAGVATSTAIAPGQRVVLAGAGSVRNTELRSFLTGATYLSRKKKTNTGSEEEHFHTITKYDPTNEDLVEIARMISLHRAAGASEYTSLTNTALRQLEVTDLTALDRAVFIGLLETPASRILIDDQEPAEARRTVIVRCLIPVTEPREANDSLPKFKRED